MPHPEREHSLQIEVARLRKEADDAHTRERSLRTALAAARRECERLRALLSDCGEVIDAHMGPSYELLLNRIDSALAGPGAGEEGTR